MRSSNDDNKREQTPEEGDKHRHGGGKNAQHGKAKPQPSKEQQLKENEAKLEELKRTQGSKKEKVKTSNKIKQLREEINKDQKGEPHRQKAPGSNSQTKR
jgi:hypothetical protein